MLMKTISEIRTISIAAIPVHARRRRRSQRNSATATTAAGAAASG